MSRTLFHSRAILSAAALTAALLGTACSDSTAPSASDGEASVVVPAKPQLDLVQAGKSLVLGGYVTSVGVKETITWTRPASGGVTGVRTNDGGHSYGLYATMPSKICLKDTWTVTGVSAGSSWTVSLPRGISYSNTSTTKSVHLSSCLTGYKSINHYWSANQVRFVGNVTSLTHTTTVTVYRNNNVYALTTVDKDVP